MQFVKITIFAQYEKKVIYLGLLAQIEGGRLNKVFLYFLYFLSYGQKNIFTPKKYKVFLTKVKKLHCEISILNDQKCPKTNFKNVKN